MPPKRASRAKASEVTEDVQDVVLTGNTPEVAIEATPETSHSLRAILERSAKRTRELFAEDQENINTAPVEEQAR
jgi:hypothetical protein